MRALALLALALLAALATFFLLRETAERDSGSGLPDPSEARREREPAASARAQDEEPATRDGAGAPDGEVTTRRAADPASALATMRGRCVAAEDRRPLAGIEVSLRGRAATLELARMHGEEPLGLPPLVTGEDGRFEFRFAAHAHFRHELSLAGAGRVSRNGWFEAFDPGAVADLGDLPFAAGVPVSGFVTDPQGTRLAGVVLSMARGSQGPTHSLDPEEGTRSGNGTSDATGAFTIRVLAPGAWTLRAQGPEFEHVPGVQQVQVQPEVGASGIHVVVRRRTSIEGTIVDQGGAPVDLGPNLKTWARTGWVGAQAVSGKDGTFKLFHTGGHPDPVQIGWERSAVRRYEDSRTEAWIEWGARGVHLVARRLPGLEVEVVEAGTGKPVEEFVVRTWREHDRSLPLPLNPGRSPGGRVWIQGLVPGATFVEVVPKRSDLAISTPVRVPVSLAPHDPVRIELARAAPFSVRVLSADRSPVPEAMVELLDPRRVAHIGHELRALDDRRHMRPGGPGVTGRADTREQTISLLSWATTDILGRAALHGPAGSPLALRVSAPAHAMRLVRDFRIPEKNGEVEVLVAAGADLHVIARPASAVGHEHVSIGIRLRRVGVTWPVDYPRPGDSYSFDAEGSARVRGIPAGLWEVLLTIRNQVSGSPVATVTLEEGKTARVELDLSRLQQARVFGKVIMSTAPPLAGTVTLDSDFMRVTVPLDESGRFVADALVPGSYELSATWMQERTRVQWAHDRFLEVTPGADLEVGLDASPRTLRLRLLHHDGEPVANASGTVGGRVLSVGLRTDEHGLALVSPVPGPKVSVRLGSQTFHDREVPAGPDPELTIRLPAAGWK